MCNKSEGKHWAPCTGSSSCSHSMTLCTLQGVRINYQRILQNHIFFLWGFVKDNVYVPPLPKTLPELRERINTAIGDVTQDMLDMIGFGGNGSVAWTSAVSHVGPTSNAFKVSMKLQTFLFQMGVSPGHLPCHTWGAHRMHLRSL